jgi:adenylate cyclase
MPLAREQRKLAAIVAADVVGYSRLMGRDESGTVARLRGLRIGRLEPLLVRHSGRLVKLTGDGALIEFTSAVDALSAAIEFQQATADANHAQPQDTAIVFRMGLHLGDVIVEGDDLYGDAVNVAYRLEAEVQSGVWAASKRAGDEGNPVGNRHNHGRVETVPKVPISRRGLPLSPRSLAPSRHPQAAATEDRSVNVTAE